MSQTATIQQLTARLGQLESELTAVRRTLETLQHPPNTGAKQITPANKDSLNSQMQQLFRHFNIVGTPVGAESLQEQMAQSNLNRNELSQSLINARSN